MNWHDFVFSKNSPQRYIRHISFWMVWGVYFFISMNFLPRQTNAPPKPVYSIGNAIEFIHVFLLLLIHMLACYSFIYFVLPRFLLRARYILLLVAGILLGLVMVLGARFVDTIVVPFLAGHPGATTPYYISVFSGLVSAIKIIAVAVAIKLVKHWWLKQKEKERLEKERIETELQLLKAQIHPSFLFSALNNIYSFSLKASPKAPEMLLKLSDILSYMLYDCADSEVELEKEIRMLKNYMALEKIRYGDKLEMNIQVKGDTSHQKIAPLLLIRFIENSFSQCSNRMTEQPWINLEIEIENHVFYMKLMNGKSPTLPFAHQADDDNLLQAKRRLQLIYLKKHQLKIVEEPEIMMIVLELALDPNSNGMKQVQQNYESIYATKNISFLNS